jgi:hypothetical protein
MPVGNDATAAEPDFALNANKAPHPGGSIARKFHQRFGS